MNEREIIVNNWVNDWIDNNWVNDWVDNKRWDLSEWRIRRNNYVNSRIVNKRRNKIR